MPNITQITPPRVAFFDNRTGDISREWYRFFYNLYYATGGTSPGGAVPVDRGGTGTTTIPANGQLLIGDNVNGVYKVADLGTGSGIAKTVGPGSLSIENTGVLSNIAGDGISVSSATGNVTIDNTGVLSIIAGQGIDVDHSTGDVTVAVGTQPYLDFYTTTPVPPRQSGRLFWDNADGNQTLSLYMAGSNAILQIGQETYYRIKASSDITEGQVVMFTGTVGASGALTGAPASGLTSDTASYIMGVATENIANNQWGYVTAFGLVRGINTSGGAESWVDGQILYYNPAVAGGLTKTVPTAPNAKIQVCAVVNASSGGSGSVFVRPTYGGKLGQFEGDVGITSPASGDLLQYDGSKWVNVTASAAATSANVYSGTYTPTTVATNTNVNSVTYQQFQYMRVGSVVTVSGRIDVTATATGNTVVQFSLPIASNLGSSVNLCGTGAYTSSTIGNNSIARVSGNGTDDCAQMQFNSPSTSSLSWFCTFTYLII